MQQSVQLLRVLCVLALCILCAGFQTKPKRADNAMKPKQENVDSALQTGVKQETADCGIADQRTKAKALVDLVWSGNEFTQAAHWTPEMEAERKQCKEPIRDLETGEDMRPECLAEFHDLLRWVTDVLTSLKKTYWLSGGSLYGCNRWGDMLPWDKDIDLEVLIDPERSDAEWDEIGTALQAHPKLRWHRVHMVSLKEPNVCCATVSNHRAWLDFRTAWKGSDDRTLCYVDEMDSYSYCMPNANLFPLRPCAIGDTCYPMANNVDFYVEHVTGLRVPNWRTDIRYAYCPNPTSCSKRDNQKDKERAEKYQEELKANGGKPKCKNLDSFASQLPPSALANALGKKKHTRKS